MDCLWDNIDTLFLINEEKVDGKGEDSYCSGIIDESAFVGAFDGSGGMGFKTYPEFKNHTGAFVASRIISGGFYDWYMGRNNVSAVNRDMTVQLKKFLDARYKKYTSSIISNNRIRGMLLRDFPTTAAFAYIRQFKNGICLDAIWAGDSRVYILDKDGLYQVSVDDVSAKDAFKNLSEDCPMDNVLSSDGRYELHHKTVSIKNPSFVFAATDGCFAYISSPMEFEYLLLDTLMESSNFNEYETRLKQSFHDVSADDFTFGLISLKFGSFDIVKASLKDRYKLLKKEYISQINKNDDVDFRYKKWLIYKSNYEKYF